MKNILIFFLLFCATTTFAAIDFSGVEALANRVSPTLAQKVSFEEMSAQGDSARIVPNGSTFIIKASSVRAASLALGVYIRDIAKGHISWCGNRYPEVWPVPESEKEVKTLYPYQMAYNYCTLSYTMAYWDESAWQKEIDRLALQGYNIALITAGLQKVWDLTLTQMGYSADQRAKYIADDAAAAWWHMGNLQGLGGPVSAADIERDAELGKWLVGAMRSVGIEPLFQGFVGLIPSTTSAGQLENANIFRMGNWVAGLKSPDILDPTCGAFEVFSGKWYENLKTVYGLTDSTKYPKFLGGDLFHESSPPSSMTADQKRQCAINAQMYQQRAFPGVVWVLQSWQSSPVQELRNGLDPKYTVIQVLDQGMHNTDACTATYKNNTTGQYLPWVWVEVLNFGGNTGMHGAFRRFRNIGNIVSQTSQTASLFKGYGLLSEGLETNPSSYDIFASTFTKSSVAEQNISDDALVNYLEDYRLRRYGWSDDYLRLAHYICSTSVWDCARNQQGTIESVFCAKPSYNITKVSSWGPQGGTPYPRDVLIEAANNFLLSAKAKPELLELETFRYDFVEIFQQILADKAREMLSECATSQRSRAQFMTLIELCDKILACSNEWRLDKKEGRISSRSTRAVSAYRRMVTTWTEGPGSSVLSEYAHRSYAGLMKHYYAKRWQAFFDIADGKKTSAQYDAYVSSLNSTFPTATLEPTPTNYNIVEVAEEILDALTAKELTWNATENNGVWEAQNWINGRKEKCEWVNGSSIILAGYNKTINAQGEVEVGNIQFDHDTTASAYIYGGNNGAYITNGNGTYLGWKGLTVDDLAAGKFKGIFSGAWMGGDKLACNGYHVTRVGDTITVQMQVRHNSAGDYVKVVSLQLDVRDDGVYGTYQWANNGSATSLGTLFTSGMTPANGAPNGFVDGVPKYGIIGLTFYPASSFTLTGQVNVTGDIVLKDGEAISLPDVESIPNLDIKGRSILNLGDGQTLTINSLNIASSAKLVIKGSSLSLGDSVNACNVKFVNSAGEAYSIPEGKVVYVSTGDPNQEEQSLVVKAATGYAARKLEAKTYEPYVTKAETKLPWRYTLDELSTMEFTGIMSGGYLGNKDSSGTVVSYRHVPTRGYRIERTDTTIKVWMQCIDDNWLKGVRVTFKVKEDGFVYVSAENGGNKNEGSLGEQLTVNDKLPLATSESSGAYGIYDLTLTPAVACVKDTLSNYASFADAITAANATTSKNLSVISDVIYSTQRGISGGVKITIERGVALISGVVDALDYGGACEIIVKGLLDFKNTRWTFSTNNQLTLYAGAKIIGAGQGNSGAIDIFNTAHNINVLPLEGYSEVVVDSPWRTRHDITFNVSEGVSLFVGSFYQSDTSNKRTILKTGLGSIKIAGTINQYATVATGNENSGTLARDFNRGDVFKVRKGTGAVNIQMVSLDPEYKIAESQDGDLTVYTSVACVWVAKVTNEVDANEETAGVRFETLEEALEALSKFENGRLWLIDKSLSAPEGWKKEDSPSGSEIWKIRFTINGEGYRSKESAFAAAKEGDKVIDLEEIITYEKINGVMRRHIYWPKTENNNWPTTIWLDRDGEKTSALDVSTDKIVFIASNVIYPPYGMTTSLCIAVDGDKELTVGHDNRNETPNLPNNSYVTLGDGARMRLIYWNNPNKGPQGDARLGNIQIDGENASFYYDKSLARPLIADNITGTATLVIGEDEKVTAISVENPIKIRGNGELILTGTNSANVKSATRGYVVVKKRVGDNVVYKLGQTFLIIIR